MHTMSASDIANHNQLCAELTENDGIPRLTWEEHCALFAQPAPTVLVVGQRIITDDSATPGTVKGTDGKRYTVVMDDMGDWSGSYPLSRIRLWPTDGN